MRTKQSVLCSAGYSVLLSKVTRAAGSNIPCSAAMAAPSGGGKKGGGAKKRKHGEVSGKSLEGTFAEEDIQEALQNSMRESYAPLPAPVVLRQVRVDEVLS